MKAYLKQTRVAFVFIIVVVLFSKPLFKNFLTFISDLLKLVSEVVKIIADIVNLLILILKFFLLTLVLYFTVTILKSKFGFEL